MTLPALQAWWPVGRGLAIMEAGTAGHGRGWFLRAGLRGAANELVGKHWCGDIFWLLRGFPELIAQGTSGGTLHSQLGAWSNGAGWAFHRLLGVSENGMVTVSPVFAQKVPSLHTDVSGCA